MEEDYQDPLSQAVIATEPGSSGPGHWTLDDNPQPDEALGRMRDYMRTAAIAGRSHDEVTSGFQQRFPGVTPPSPEEYKPWQDRAPAEAKLDQVRYGVNKEQPTDPNANMRAAIAFPREIMTSAVYGIAKRRFDNGNADDSDLRNMALYEREQRWNRQRNDSWGGWAANTALALPSHAAGLMLGGAAADAIAPGLAAGGGLAAQAGRTVLQTAATPDLYLQRAIQNNTQAGRDAFDVTGLASGFGLGLAQMVTLRAVGGLVDRALPTTTIGGRMVVQGLTGPIAQQATDIVTSAVGLDTGYGAVGLLLQGKAGDALKHVAGDALTFAAFGAMHGAATEEPAGQPDAGANGGANSTPNAPPNSPAGGGQPAGPPGLPKQGQAIFDAFTDALNHLNRNGYRPEAAGGILKNLTDQLKSALRSNPDLTRAEARELFKDYGDGPVKRFVDSLIDVMPEKAAGSKTSPNAPGREPPPEPTVPAEAPDRAAGGEPATPEATQASPPEPAQPPDLFNQPAEQPGQPAAAPEQGPVDRRQPGRVTIGEHAVLRRGEPMDPAEAHAVEKFGEGNVFRVALIRDGEHAGHATIAEEGNSLHVAWVGADGLAGGEGRGNHPFGTREIMSLAADLARAVPDAEFLKYEPSEGRINAGKKKVIDLVKLRERGQPEKPPPSVLPADRMRERVLSGEDVPAAELRQLGLTAREAHVVRERALNKRGLADIGRDKEIGPKGVYSKEMVRQIEKSAREKLGIKVSFEDAVIGREKAARIVDLAERGGAVDAGDLHAVGEHVRPIVKKKLDAIDKAQGGLDKLAEQFLKEVDDAGPRGLSPERRAFFDAEAARIHATSQGQPQAKVVAAAGPAGPPAQRPAQQPASLYGAGPGSVQRPAAPASPPQQGAGLPAPALPFGQTPDAGQPQAAGNELTPEQLAAADAKAKEIAAAAKPPEPKPPQKPMLPFEREWRKKAEEAGLSYDSLKSGADQVLAENAGKVDEHNEIVRRAMMDLDVAKLRQDKLAGKLKPTGFNWVSVRALAGEDHASVPGIDGVAQELAESFGRPDLDPEKLFDMLREGIRRPLTKTEAHQAALDEWNDHKEAERAKKEAQGLGWPRGAAEEALRRGQADGGTEATDREGDARGEAHEPGVDDLEYGLGTDFDPSEFGAADPDPADAGSEPLANAIGKPLARAVVDWLKEEDAAFTFAGNIAAVKETVEKMKRAVSYTADALGRISGRMMPATTKLDRGAGEAVARFAAVDEYAKRAAEHYADQVLGPKASEAADLIAGAVITERRLRYMRLAFQRAGRPQDAAAVQSIIGAAGSPLKTLADYHRVLNSPRMQGILRRWIDEVVPVAEDAYRRAEGLLPTDPIDALTQIPGQPVTLKALKPGEENLKSGAFVRGRQGNLSNPRARKLKHTLSATGQAEAYDLSLRNIVENMLVPRLQNAAKAEMYRELETAGLLKWTTEGKGADFGDLGGRELPNVKPPRGTQAAQFGQTSAYVHPHAYGEVRKALAVDESGDWTHISRAVTALPTVATLASFVEVATHAINLSGGLFGPNMNPVKLGLNAYQRLWNRPAAQERLLALTRIGATKPQGVSGGTVVNQIDAFLKPVGAKLPDAAKYVDPSYWGGRALHVLDDVMRLTASDAYDSLAAAGHLPNTETGKRDFLNQLYGQYNAKAQNGLVALARATGIGPFATAGSTMTARAIRAVFGGGVGVKANGLTSAARLRAESYARLLGILGAGMAMNFLAWGRWDGDEATPFGAIKLGKTPAGKTEYIDTPASLIVRRGTRSVGLLAWMEGARRGQTTGQEIDRTTKDVVESMFHPLLGPAYQLAHEAYTGEDLVGHRIAEHAKKGESQKWLNTKAAFGHANPVYASMVGNDPGQKPTLKERLMKFLGPFGVKTASPPKRQ